MSGTHVQYGCGLSAPDGWLNYDSSPTLRMQRMPLLGPVFRSTSAVKFPRNVRYGDIIKGLPLPDASCDALYCSHTLEHLSLEDCRTALANTYRLLKPGGVFRCVLPDLERAARSYIAALDAGDETAGVRFMGRNTIIGTVSRPRGFGGMLRHWLGNSLHLWMWDELGLSAELRQVGFRDIRRCAFNDAQDPAFLAVEDEGRFNGALALECWR